MDQVAVTQFNDEGPWYVLVLHTAFDGRNYTQSVSIFQQFGDYTDAEICAMNLRDQIAEEDAAEVRAERDLNREYVLDQMGAL